MKTILLVTIGLIRDHKSRRWVMLVLIGGALLMLHAGATWLNGWLAAAPLRFILFWLVCAWLTLTALLVAVFDLALVGLAARRQRAQLKASILGLCPRNGPDGRQR